MAVLSLLFFFSIGFEYETLVLCLFVIIFPQPSVVREFLLPISNDGVVRELGGGVVVRCGWDRCIEQGRLGAVPFWESVIHVLPLAWIITLKLLDLALQQLMPVIIKDILGIKSQVLELLKPQFNIVVLEPLLLGIFKCGLDA